MPHAPRRLVRTLLLVGVLLGGLCPLPVHGQEGASVEAIAITVSDVEAATAFYHDVLGFEPVGAVDVTGAAHDRLMGVFGLRMRVQTLRLGDERVELTEFVAPSTGRPVPADRRSTDHAFQHIAIIVSDMDSAYAHLRRHDVAHVSPGPQTLPDWNPAAGGIEAFYFEDPDGHVLELLAFPPDKGAARWHRPTDRLFLGIDHTAIVVADTEASEAFYRDALGFTVAGRSLNYGPEQERLNSVFGAKVRITRMQPPGGGPSVEFLDYLAPATGRPMPEDTRANDLWHWHVRLHTPDLDARAAAMEADGAPLVSPGVQDLPDDALGYRRGLMVRDPTGHALLLTE